MQQRLARRNEVDDAVFCNILVSLCTREKVKQAKRKVIPLHDWTGP